MGRTPLAVVLVALAAQAMAAPQLLTFGKGGEVGVNFGGYHASAGLGGILNGAGAGGLHAEAGTPHGQAARAGLGGHVAEGSSAGGLYAGATAGGGVRAAAGLEGATGGAGAAGAGYSAAQAGGHSAAAGLGGESSNAGSAGFSFAAHKSVGYGGGGAVVKEVEAPPPVDTVKVQPAHHEVKHKKVTTVEEETVNYVNEAPPPTVVKTVAYAPVVKTVKTEIPVAHVEKHVEVQSEAHAPVVYKEVSNQSRREDVQRRTFDIFGNLFSAFARQRGRPSARQPFRTSILQQVYAVAPVVRYKPRHHHKAWAGGYFGAGGGFDAGAPPTKVVYKEVAAPAQRRVDVVAESDVAVGVQPVDVGYTKRVNFQHRNPTFFSDIFNIPIQTLSAVGKFLGNAAGSTSVSVEKSAYAHADGESPKAYSSDASVAIKTPSVTSIIDDVLAIPINTLGAVNKFLENNVGARKKVVVQVKEP